MPNKTLRDEVLTLKRRTAILDDRDLGQHKALVERLMHLGDVVAALISLAGEEAVDAKITELRKARIDAAEAKAKVGVEKLVTEGVLVPAETIVPGSFLVGRETSPQGERRVQFELDTLTPDSQARYLGKKVGDEFASGDVKVVITEVYSVDVEKSLEAMKAAVSK